jgi:predicted enzyme related to lactoylglutathione lyase
MAKSDDLRPYAFVLAVQDLARSAAYFEDVLGFRLEWKDADDFRLLCRGGVRMMIGHCPNEKPAREIGDHSYIAYLEIDDVDALHAEIAPRGAIIRQPPADKPWRMREMLIATPDGHRIMVGQPL